MYKKIVINETEHETRVALLEDETIAELFVQRGDESDIAGNIYKGRVQRVLPGIHAAFINIGLEQAGFIYVNDVATQSDMELEEMLMKSEEPDYEILEEEKEEVLSKTFKNINRRIEELLTENQEILVQIDKSPIGSKGARITSHISLPGRFLVLMPKSDHIGISRRIEDSSERERLKEITLSLRKNNSGYIIRTAAEGIQKEKIAYEMAFLNNMWENIQHKFKKAPAPYLLHKELTASLRAVRDLLIYEAEKLVIDSRKGYESIITFVERFSPGFKGNVELYEGQEPVFDAYNLEGDILRALKKKVWLRSGGSIVIEHTEALVAIDVNTGRYVGKHNLEETILKTNLEAVKEIAYQIRLRDIGGIIIIDFIDMEKRSNQDKVFNELKEAFKKDRRKTNILPISEMGIIQMTRKRSKKPLSRMLCEPCFYCEGEGYLISKQSICYNIYREIKRDMNDITNTKILLKVNTEIADLLHGEESEVISSLEKEIGKEIIVYANSKYHMEEFEIFESLKSN
jgi:ribonuclease G